MAKVRASLADVSTKFELISPDTYRLKVAEIKEKTEAGRQNFNFKIAVNDSGEHQGKIIYHNIAMHTKQGEQNDAGVRDLKRFAEAILGIDPEDDSFDWDAFDTDDLLKGEFLADVIIENWVKDEGKPTEKKGQSNKINSRTIAPLG
jgi:hypothetical protein